MKNLKIFYIFMLIGVVFLSACNVSNAQSVTFSDITGAGSPDTTISVVYQEEYDYKQKATDIYIKSNVDNLIIQIKQELNNFITISLLQKNEYYSLSKLIANAKIDKVNYQNYSKAKNVNIIINSNQDCNLIFKAVVGDLDANGFELQNEIDVSKEFVISIQKHQK